MPTSDQVGFLPRRRSPDGATSTHPIKQAYIIPGISAHKINVVA